MTLGAAGLALALGAVGRAVDAEALDLFSGLFWIAAIVLAISLLPFWRRTLPEVPPMPGLFSPVPEGHRWCTHCGTPAPRGAACGVCGHAKPVRAKAESAKRSG